MHAPYRVFNIALIFCLALALAATADGLRYDLSARIQATAKVVPPVGIEPNRDPEQPGNASLFWLHSPRPGGVYVTVEDRQGRPLAWPVEKGFSVLEEHRYRALISIPSDHRTPAPSEPVTITVIYTGN